MTRPERSGYRIDTKLLFGKYRIISTLGAGSSGTVYLAEHLKLKVYRAIKCIDVYKRQVPGSVIPALLHVS